MTTRYLVRPVALATLLAAGLCASSATAQTWSAGPSFPQPIVRAAGVFFPANGNFYALGGRSSDAAGSDIMSPSEYNPTAGTWTLKTAVFNDNQVCNMVGGVLNDAGTPVIFLVGGSAAGAATSTNVVRRYDPATDTLSVLASDPWSGAPANTLGGGAAVFNNKLYVFGGFTIGVGMTSQVWEFDPAGAAGSKWTMKASVLPVQVGYVPCTTIGSLIYGAGGATYNLGALIDSTSSWVFDPAADTIAPINPTPRMVGETKGVNESGQLWVLGGGRTTPNPSNQVDAYSPGPNSWALAPAMAAVRRNFAADADPATGKIYVVGGYSPATAISAMEIFSGPSPIISFCGEGDPTLTTPCPCAVQGGTGRGCENSATTGGASLTATGNPVPDTLVLTSSGELPTALSIFLQGTTSTPAGVVFGTGVRCATGTLKRLYVHNAVGGVVSAPVGTDLPVTARSAALGDPIAPGSKRFYGVYYRDPAGGPTGCGGLTYNISNALSIQF
jgi:hypothetical protein